MRLSKNENRKFNLLTCIFFGLLIGLLAMSNHIYPTPVDKKPPPPILSACETDYPPFCLVDARGQASGFSVELLEAAMKAMNRQLNFRIGTWDEVRGWLETGEIDALPLVGRTEERDATLDFTVPYMTLSGALVVRDETRDVFGLDDLRGRRVAVMKGDNAEEFLRRKARDIDIFTTATFPDALRALSRGQCDAVLIQRLVALRLINETGLRHLHIVDRPVEGFRQDFCFAVQEGDRDTLALLNEGLAVVIADGRYSQLHAKWFASLELPSSRRIIIGGDHHYPPFEFLDEKGNPSGYSVDLSRALAKEMGLEIDIRLGPWSDIVSSLERREIDIIQGMFYLPSRDLKFDFSQPHSVNHYISVVRRADGPAPTTLAELNTKRLIVQRGDVIHDFLIDNGLGHQISLVESQEDVLAELAAGKHDCGLAVRFSSLYFIKKHGWDNLLLGRGPFVSLDYCFAVPNGDKAMLSQLNEGLKILKESGEYRRIYNKWLGAYSPPIPSLIAALRSSALILIPLVLILLTAFLWSWSLRRKVAHRTKELRDSLERFRLLAEEAPVGIVILDKSQKTIHASKRFTELYGYTLEDIPDIKAWWPLAYPDEALRAQVRRNWEENIQAAKHSFAVEKPMEFPVHCKDGRSRLTEFRLAKTADLNFLLFSDVTEQRKLEDQLRQAQKMEAVGRLAGGVAHDYNNMLSIIIGYTEIAMKTSPTDAQLSAYHHEILNAANRSKEITRQLLAFARKQTIKPVFLDLNETIESMLKMLRHLIGEDIDLAWLPDTGLWTIRVDPSQIDQILANLCINARDSISGPGKITIETENVTATESFINEHRECLPGQYVVLAVSDSGCGMDKITKDNIFEPFFTTKDMHEGTGLGLATVYGIIKQNSGFITVYSEPGQGSTFKLYFPRQTGENETVAPRTMAVPSYGRGQTILLVEDEKPLLELFRKMLAIQGYTVLAANSPDAAVKIAHDHTGRIQLLISDVIMPEMTGSELAVQIQALNPELIVLFMSGYTANVIARHGVLDEGINFIQKPISTEALATKVRDLLDDRPKQQA